jgi:predicted ferric reductase
MDHMLKKSGVWFGWGVALISVVLWLMSGEVMITSLWSGFRILGQVCGLLGISLFAINFVLATRLPWIEYLFSGLDKVYRAHHRWGAYAFTFMLLHPTFLALQYLGISAQAVLQFLVSGLTDFAVLWGELAIGTVFVVLFVTFYVKTRYEHWKSLHQWIGLGGIFAGIHAYVIPSTTARYEPLRWYVLSLATAGIIAWLYTTVFKKFGYKKHKYIVTKVTALTNITEIKMKPVSKHLYHKPGQFGFFAFSSTGIEKKPHPFSFTSVGKDGLVSIAAKALGDFTTTLQLLKPGTAVTIEGPYGEFGHGGVAGAQRVWIAGGIGITPYLSMARNLVATDPDTVLWYSVKKKSEAIYLEEFEVIEKANKNFTFHLVVTDEDGYITGAQVLESVDAETAEFFVCGPTPMMDGMDQQLTELGVDKHRIHNEKFALS